MNQFSISITFILFIGAILAKDLHVKENLSEIKENSISDLTYRYEDIANNDRFVRHVEFVTESVVDHLMKKIKKKYSNLGQNNTSMILQRLRMRLKKRFNKKNKKLRKKKKENAINSTNKLKRLP